MGGKTEDEGDGSRDLENGSRTPTAASAAAAAAATGRTAALHRAGAVAGRATRPSAVARLSRLLSVRSGTARVVLAAGVSVAWMFFSNFLIIVNKHILKDLKFP
jgi:hypothetical protein